MAKRATWTPDPAIYEHFPPGLSGNLVKLKPRDYVREQDRVASNGHAAPTEDDDEERVPF